MQYDDIPEALTRHVKYLTFDTLFGFLSVRFSMPLLHFYCRTILHTLVGHDHVHGLGRRHYEVLAMFGIGLPEMILIMALALIVIGPDKLPDLARSLAKGLMELKKTAESLKTSFAEEGNPLDEIRPELEEAAKSLKTNLLDSPTQLLEPNGNPPGAANPANMAAEAYEELKKQTGNLPNHNNGQTTNNMPEKTQDNEVTKPKEAPAKPETGINELQ